MGAHVDFDKGGKGDRCGIKMNNHGFGPCVIGGSGLHEALFGLLNTAQRLKHRFGTPMAAAAEGYFTMCCHGS